MQWAPAVGLEKIRDGEHRTEKPITEANLIADGSLG